MSGPRSARTVRKWIVGGCRKCRKPAAENHGRCLCGACYGEEYAAGRIGQWPKTKRHQLTHTRPEPHRAARKEAELPLAAAPAAATRVSLAIPPEAAPLWQRLEAEARDQFRTPESIVCCLLKRHFTEATP